MKKILILGSNGFVGRNLVGYLHSVGGYEILCPSRRELDLIKEEEVGRYLEKHRIDVVVHSAIFTPQGEADEQLVVENDLRIFYNLEKYSDMYEKMIYLGSGAEYGKQGDISSVCEEQIGERIPSDPYGFAKYVIGKHIEQSSNIYNFRIWGLFGKYEDWWSTFISGCCCKAIKNYPLSIRQDLYFDYVWIDDFCRVLEWSIDHDLKYHTYNVGSGKRVRLSEIAEDIRRISGKHIDIFICEAGLGREYTANRERLIKEYGREYCTPMADAIQNVYQWYMENEKIINMRDLIY